MTDKRDKVWKTVSHIYVVYMGLATFSSIMSFALILNLYALARPGEPADPVLPVLLLSILTMFTPPLIKAITDRMWEDSRLEK